MIEVDLFKNIHVFYVEDDSMVRESTLETLNILFDHIVVAQDGLEAIEILQEETFDIALIDFNLPGYSGIEIGNFIRKKNQDTMMIMISANYEVKYLRKAMRAGFHDYLPKPFTLDELLVPLLEYAKKFTSQKIRKLRDNLSYDTVTRQLYKDKTPFDLTKNEILFIELLVRNKSHLLSYDMIVEEIFNSTDIELHLSSVKNIVFRLRKKLNVDFLENVFGIGYRIL